MQQLLLEEKRSLICALLLIEAIMTSGCTLLNVNRQIEDFSTHAEKVFRHQNLVIDQVMQANEDIDEARYKVLSHAELNMYDQCRLLNDYAVRERDGLDHDFLLHQQILNSIEDCEASIKAVEKLLPH